MQVVFQRLFFSLRCYLSIYIYIYIFIDIFMYMFYSFVGVHPDESFNLSKSSLSTLFKSCDSKGGFDRRIQYLLRTETYSICLEVFKKMVSPKNEFRYTMSILEQTIFYIKNPSPPKSTTINNNKSPFINRLLPKNQQKHPHLLFFFSGHGWKRRPL